MIKYIAKFLKALNANSKPSEIANALCLGIMLGLMPKNNALWYIILVFFAFVRINKGFYFITMLIVSRFAWLLDGTFDSIGLSVLNYPSLTDTFAFLIDIPFVGFTKFNNTIVAGSLIFSLIVYIPFFFLTILFVKLWRKYASVLFIKIPITKVLSKIPFAEKIINIIKEKLL